MNVKLDGLDLIFFVFPVLHLLFSSSKLLTILTLRPNSEDLEIFDHFIDTRSIQSYLNPRR
jgi:hypothetical protein